MSNVMFDVMTLGETMLRMSPPGNQRLEQAPQVGMFVGGAESNVAVALARLGKRTAWFSRLPDNPLGHLVANTIRQYGVDVSHVVWAEGERLGLYYAEFSAPPRPIRVWYDRADSAASHMTVDDLPLTLIEAARWLHLTGITPALSPSCKELIGVATQHALTQGIHVSFDVNYRTKLWSPQSAAQTLTPFCEQADVVMIALRDAQNLFGTQNNAESAVNELQKRWNGIVVVTNGANGAFACDGNNTYYSPAFEVTPTDRLGAGDAFDAGLICRLLENASLDDALRFGAAMAALKLTIPGDFAIVSRAEIEELILRGAKQLHR